MHVFRQMEQEKTKELRERTFKEGREEMDVFRQMEQEKTKELECTFIQFAGVIMAVCCFVAGRIVVHFVRR